MYTTLVMQASVQCTLPSDVSLLAAPPPSFVDDTAFIPGRRNDRYLRDSTRHVVKKQLWLEDELVAEGLMQRSNGATPNGSAQTQEEERVEVGLRQRLKGIGCCAGGHIAERYLPSLATCTNRGGLAVDVSE